MYLAYVGVVMRLHSGHCYSPIYDVCCWHLIVALCNLPLDNTSSTCEAKFINSVFLYFSELRRRNSLGHFCILNCIFCSLNDLLVFSYSVSGLHPTLGGFRPVFVKKCDSMFQNIESILVCI